MTVVKAEKFAAVSIIATRERALVSNYTRASIRCSAGGNITKRTAFTQPRVREQHPIMGRQAIAGGKIRRKSFFRFLRPPNAVGHFPRGTNLSLFAASPPHPPPAPLLPSIYFAFLLALPFVLFARPSLISLLQVRGFGRWESREVTKRGIN